MNNMEKEFVPYELAVKLKELGFNEKCFMAYFKLLRHEFYDFRSASNIIFNEDNPIKLLNYASGDFRVKECDAPLWQQAFLYIFKISNGKINISIDGKDNYESLSKKLEQATKDFRYIQNNQSIR